MNPKAIVNNIYQHSKIKRYTQFIFGCLLVALAFNLFYSPNNIVAGGVSGLSIVLNNFFKFNQSYVILIANIFLLILSFIFLGKEKTKLSILGSILFPVFVNLTSFLSKYVSFNQSEMLLVAIFGGLLQGVGAGLIFKAGFSTGGTDILAKILNKYSTFNIGISLLLVDLFVVVCGGLTFGLDKGIYSLLAVIANVLIVDAVIAKIEKVKSNNKIEDDKELRSEKIS